MQLHTSVIPACQEVEARDSLDVCKPSSLVGTAVNNRKLPFQIRWTWKTNTQGCPLICTCIQVHTQLHSKLTGIYDLTPTHTYTLHTYIIHTHFGRVLNSCARSQVWPPSTATNKHLFFSHFNTKVLYNTLRKTVMKTGHCTSNRYVMML